MKSSDAKAVINKSLINFFLLTVSSELAKAKAPIVEKGLMVTMWDATAIVMVKTAGEITEPRLIDKS